ncbi:Glycogen debranching enzyme [Taphrina deformans PYCC 5710]|uniref:Glycogen debranching enzyme n=1 Tax=Taphrina deformans (strain PYCC 5710 / ATCC 11124 / CBS 356.35 / IMI 108563 / JCM 9778 / NBRC 8474) TaxID=1097556 RepID=R4X711_TAPDE|nr:Glycogen debranching enzyme [Taphrina deformans PYCC 5710]|eukprot:CCG80823.1 Glycogen debranching enzyme [Taphrina deformans PYCC 5710]
MAQSQKAVHVLRLDDLGAPVVDGKYIKLPAPYEPYILRFELDGNASVCRAGTFTTNYPIDGSDFSRETTHKIQLQPDWNKNVQIDIEVRQAGAFSWSIDYQPLPEWSAQLDNRGSNKTKSSGPFYFAVEAAVRLNDKPLPLNALAIQSVVSKWMGPVTEWQPRLKYMSKTKRYNMLHFTPLQQRGESNSSYSLYDQNCLADDLFEDGDKLSAAEKLKQLTSTIQGMEKDHELLALTDVVWNHTANNSDWLLDHPDAGYNLENSPHLCAAYALDTALLDFSENLGRFGLPTDLKNTGDLLRVMEGMKSRVFGQIKLWEFYVIDTKEALKTIAEAANSSETDSLSLGTVSHLSGLEEQADKALELGIVPDYKFLGDRFSKKVDAKLFSSFVTQLVGDASVPVAEVAAALLDEINLKFYKEYDVDQEHIIEQLYNRIKYMRVEESGLRLGPITKSSPLIESYFTRLPENKRTSKHSKGALALANNGWMWGANPLEDFAGRASKAYLVREVIVWSDCVKLRYGSKPEDSPFLWKHMIQYTTTLASIFHGFRIDNCHSTPIPVATVLLDEARKVRPDLYIVAELFTGSEDMDIIFMQKLGIGSLIREAMQAHSTAELSRLVHRYGGVPIGSIDASSITTVDDQGQVITPVKASDVHAFFMDCTHDNEVPNQKRCAEDTLPNGALVAMTGVAIGSVMGYDEIYPHILDIVAEDRKYSTEDNGIATIKGRLNQIHARMALDGYTECHIHHEAEYVTVHRVHPKTQKGYYLIAHTAFSKGEDRGDIGEIRLTGTKVSFEFATVLEVSSTEDRSTKEELRGLPAKLKELKEPHVHYDHGDSNITVPDYFPRGSIALFSTCMPSFDSVENAETLDSYIKSGADKAVNECDLVDLNILLYRCDAEEQDSISDGSYRIPDYGSLVYCGLQGWMAPLKDIVRWNNLGHPLCNHLREGQWAFDYILGRLKKYTADGAYSHLSAVIEWLDSRFGAIRGKLPNFLIPKYFTIAVHTLYTAARTLAIRSMATTVSGGDRFTQNLALCSLQMQGKVKSASLAPAESTAAMAAGLPHFSVSWARCWGRDIFIAIRGLFLVTGRHDEAREHILAFATTLKHGMIPNLLDSIRTPRYNSRDSIWFYMQSIQDYVTLVPGGESILTEKVKRRFPLDDKFVEWDSPEAYAHESSIVEVIQETLQRHASGIHFREANAGPNLDMQMTDEGFNIDIEVDWSTGIIFGGSQTNCGTWMDKMGESEKAGSKGIPGTPRDGAAVEITGLLKSTLRWVIELKSRKLFPYDGVKATIDGKAVQVSYKRWNDLLQENFEKCYYIPAEASDDSKYDVVPEIINRRGIYKDLYRSGKPYEDYQLRAQVPMAMTVAPELFDIDHALSHLAIADRAIRGPLGIATLDPSDNNYRPYYNNSEDSSDFHTSKGRNYHQGPEWVFPMGYFLRALLYFSLKKNARSTSEIVQYVHNRLRAHKEEIELTPWAGLTELTNKNGEICGDSSPTQAWSSGTLLDVLSDISALGK